MAKLSKIISRNKKTLILVLGLGLFLSFLPLQSIQAADPVHWWDYPALIFDYFLTLPLRTGALFVAIPLAIIAVATGILYTIITVLLGWFKTIVLSVPILPVDVSVVQAGWEITRNLANMGFILILVFIGLATILRIKDYEAKKLLPTLIIVALLINFSPVIVGFVVDISNLITNFFLNLGSWESTVTAWSIIGDYFEKVFVILTGLGPIWSVIGNVVGTLILGVVLICFFGYSAWIYLLVAFLFIARIIVLWIIMILAPLAFLFYVLPAGKKLAKEWWQQLVQWAILAIPLGFFLFLSFKVLESTTQVNNIFKMADLKASTSAAIVTSNTMNASTTASFGGFTGQLADAVGVILVPLVSTAILDIGYKLSKSYMPAAAKGIINGIEKVAKMAAGAALVVATGGAAAGLAVKGLGGIAKGAQGVENFMGRVPLVGKPLKYLSKPMSWATRGMEKAATPALLEYQAKTRRLPDKEVEKIDKMAPADAENYINAKTKMLPAGLRSKQRLQYQARMTEKDTLKFTSPEFQNEAGANARSIFTEGKNKEGNPYYQKEATDIAKNLPSTFEGPEGQEAYESMKAFGKRNRPTDPARDRAIDEAREELRGTKDEIIRRFKDDNEAMAIEVGLKYKYIFKEDVTNNRVQAIRDATAAIQANGLNLQNEMGKIAGNAAPAATFVKELKPEDVKKLADPDTLTNRIGLTLGNPRNLQRIQDSFGQKKFKGVIEGAGGLNSATNTPDKLDYYAKKVNPAMAQAIFTSPAYREVDLEARNNMLDPDDQPTNRSTDFNDRIRIQKGLESHAELGKYDGDKKNEATLVEKINETEADLRKLETEMRGAENERKRLEKEAKDAGTESIRLAAEARRATGSKKTDLEAESRKTEIEQGKLENRAKKAEAERIRLETAVNTERAKISPIVSGPKATLRGLQSQIATEKTTIEADRELNRIWKEIEELRK